MLLAYLALLLVLAAVQLLVRWRVARLERQYTRVAGEADALLRQTGIRPGNSNKSDPFLAARQQLELARVGIYRDKVEARYAAWQSFCERFAHFRRRLAGYRGKALPYLVGVVDVGGALLVMSRLGIDLVQVRAMLGI